MRLKFYILFLLACCSASAQTTIRTYLPRPRTYYVEPDTVEMVFIGDVMMHARQLEYDYTDFLEPLRPLLSQADIAVANMEFTLAGKPYSGYPAFSAPDGYATYVKDLGVDVFLTANNHITDKGENGLRRTLHIYDSLRVRHTGTGLEERTFHRDNPLMLYCKGLRIALVNFTYGTNTATAYEWPSVSLMDKDEVSRQVSRARELGADIVIAVPHWGTEYSLRHSREQEHWAQWLEEKGVDAIIGAHPHVVQDTTSIGAVPVIYSMGNAVSNMSAENTRLELAVTLKIAVDRHRKASVLTPELTFLWCTLPGKLTDGYQTIPVKKYLGHREMWISPSDYDNMVTTYRRVRTVTGIQD